MNLSSRKFTITQLDMLNRGLNFSLDSRKVDTPKLLASIEPAIKKLNGKDKHAICTGISRILVKHMNNIEPYQTPSFNVIKEISSDSSIVVTRADKGRVTVIMDRCMYNEKVLELLDDNTTYLKLKKDLTPSIQRKLNSYISEFEKKKILHPSVAKNLKCYTGFAPLFYGLPKIHKQGFPLRPIVDYTRSPLYNLSRYLSNVLKPFICNSNYSLNSAFKFLNDLKLINIPSDCIMISLDVVSLFTSIPLTLACDIIKEIYPKFVLDSSLNIDIIIELTNFCLSSNCFMYDNCYYRQITGAAMGSPLSVRIAEIVMQYFEEKINFHFHDKIYFWRRYVDDVFLITNPLYIDQIVDYANSLCPSIQFTSEFEENNRLPFLDILIERNTNHSDVKFITSVYRKSTFSGQYLNFDSVNPLSHKLAVVRTLLHRAKYYCSTYELLQIELRIIFSDLKKNGYPPRWLKRVFKEVLHPVPKPKSPSNKNSNSFISIPYYKGISESIARLLKSINISTSFKPQLQIKNLLANSKPSIPPLDRTGMIYCIPCKSCSSTYIGETGRTGIIRVKEHRRAFRTGEINSKLVNHAMDTDHIPDFDNSKVLASGFNNYDSRIFLESVYTKLQPSPLNEAMTLPSEYTILF